MIDWRLGIIGKLPRSYYINQPIELRSESKPVKAYRVRVVFSPISIATLRSLRSLVKSGRSTPQGLHRGILESLKRFL